MSRLLSPESRLGCVARQPLKPVQVIFGSMSVSTLDARHSTPITNKAATIRALYQDRINPKSFKRKARFPRSFCRFENVFKCQGYLHLGSIPVILHSKLSERLDMHTIATIQSELDQAEYIFKFFPKIFYNQQMT